ncbi:MAG: DUF3078 domain-containing protein [Solirubrobacteraceae bacterium]
MMNKLLLIVSIFLQLNLLTAQTTEGISTVEANLDLIKAEVPKKDSVKIKNWKTTGVFNFSANQSTFNNWFAGGNNNISFISGINYDFNYKKNTWLWDNKIILGYGLSQNEGQKTVKTDDRIELNSIIGKQASKNWSYTFFGNFRTQFTDGFNLAKDPNDKFRTSTFLAPGYLTFGPGFMWKKSDKLFFNLAPVTSKMTIISQKIYTFDALSNPIPNNMIDVFGVKANESLRYELGFFASAFYEFNLMENISIKNSLALYSNYLEKPENVDLDYTALINMKINKYLATSFTFQMIYDDNAFRGLQTRQILGVGLNYNFTK